MKIRIGRLLIAAVLMIGLLTVAVYAGPAIAPTQDNTPPVAAFSVDPTSGVVGTHFVFDPSATHDNEDSLAWLLIQFDWDGDGVYDTGWLNPANPASEHVFDAVGDYNVTMRVKDTGGLIDTVSHIVHVGDPGSNTPPTARCTVTPASGPAGTIFTFSAASSTDGQDAAKDLLARWNWYAGGWDTDWLPITQQQTHQFNYTGEYDVRVRVKDTGALSDDATCTVRVVDESNTPPTAVLAITPSSGTITTTFTIDPTGSHDDEDSLPYLSVIFDWTDDGVYDTSWLNASQIQHVAFPNVWGDITVRMRIKDTGGLTDESAQTIHVTTPYRLFLPAIH